MSRTQQRFRARAVGSGAIVKDSMAVKSIMCAGVAVAGIVLPAGAAGASTSAGTGYAAVNASSAVGAKASSPSVATCSIVGTFGIGGKATDILPNAITCATDYLAQVPAPGVQAAVAELNNAEHAQWEDYGAYPTAGSVQSVTSDLTTAASELDQARRANRVPSMAEYLVSAEQWIAQAAFSIDSQYVSMIDSSSGLGPLVNVLVDESLTTGSQDYSGGQYAQATSDLLNMLPVDYQLVPPPSCSGFYCLR